MRWQRKVVLVALGVASAFAALMLVVRVPSRLATPEPAAPVTVEEPKQLLATAPAVGPAPRNPIPEIDPRAREFADRERFHADVRTFFAEAPALSQSEKVERGRAIAKEISHYEAVGELSASEALVLKIALIRETVPDQAAQTAQVVALQNHYRAESERLQAEWQAHPDPAFELYKAREREIAAQVNAMSEIPEGLSRNEYLRQRLQRAREEAGAAADGLAQ